MQASVEGRLPHQAPEMVEFLIAMPAKLRFNKGDETKHLLRKVVNRHIGGKISKLPKKCFKNLAQLQASRRHEFSLPLNARLMLFSIVRTR